MNHIKPEAFSEVMDRMFQLSCLHPGPTTDLFQPPPKSFHNFKCGHLTHVFISRKGRNYVAFVPTLSTQFLVDAYGA